MCRNIVVFVERWLLKNIETEYVFAEACSVYYIVHIILKCLEITVGPQKT